MSSLWETFLLCPIVLLWPPRGQLELSAAPPFSLTTEHPSPPQNQRGRIPSRFGSWKGAPAGGLGCGLASDFSPPEPGRVSHGSMPARLGVASHRPTSLLSCKVLNVIILPFLKQEKVNSLRKGEISLHSASGHHRPHGALLLWGPIRAGRALFCSAFSSWHCCVQARWPKPGQSWAGRSAEEPATF